MSRYHTTKLDRRRDSIRHRARIKSLHEASAAHASRSWKAAHLLSTVFGDFNRDGFDDLAVGVPGEDVGTVVDAGAVNVLYGTASGLAASRQPDLAPEQRRRPGRGRGGRPLRRGPGGRRLQRRRLRRPGHRRPRRGRRRPSTRRRRGQRPLRHRLAGCSASGNQLWHQDSTASSRTRRGGRPLRRGPGRAATSTATAATTWPSASRARTSGASTRTPARSTSSTAPPRRALGERQPVLAPGHAGVHDSAEADDRFGRPWPRATSTATAATTWPSASRTRASGAVDRSPAPSTSSTAPPSGA